MDREPVYRLSGENVDRRFVWSGGNVQDYGLSPWADWVCLTRGQVGPWPPAWQLEEGDQIYAFKVVDLCLPDGQVGDTCMLHVHGGSGTYQAWYVHDGVDWAEQGSTAPWQLST